MPLAFNSCVQASSVKEDASLHSSHAPILCLNGRNSDPVFISKYLSPSLLVQMESPVPPSIPSLRRQRPSVDYIDNHLPERHEAFRNHGAQYNPDEGCYVPAPISTIAMNDRAGPVELHCRPVSDGDGHSDDSKEESPLARGLPPETAAMKFWGLIFDDALKRFKNDYPAPKRRSETAFDIRNAAGWDAVYSKLQLAREAYDGTKKGFLGHMKNTSRKISDHAAGITRVAKLIPEGSYTSPVRAAVDVLLDVSLL